MSAAVGRLMAAGKRRVAVERAVRSLDAGPASERFLTPEGVKRAGIERRRTENWIAELRGHFEEQQ